MEPVKIEESCLAIDCERLVDMPRHGLCRGHYERYRRKGDVGSGTIAKKQTLMPYREFLLMQQQELDE